MMALRKDVEFRQLTRPEHFTMLDRSKILAVFVEVGDAYGVMINGEEYLTREEKTALIRAAQALPTRD
jgi:hypothetical protein